LGKKGGKEASPVLGGEKRKCEPGQNQGKTKRKVRDKTKGDNGRANTEAGFPKL